MACVLQGFLRGFSHFQNEVGGPVARMLSNTESLIPRGFGTFVAENSKPNLDSSGVLGAVIHLGHAHRQTPR
jgi:hypothetical protein